MEIIYLKGQTIEFDQPICSAIGFFDGLHLGHMALVDEVVRVSNQKGYKKALMTFDHHPLYVLGKYDKEAYLTSQEDRIALLEDKGIDYLFVIVFTKEVARLSPKDFICKYIETLNIKHIVCGFDFKFGYKNQGTSSMLKELGNIDVSIIDEVLYKDEKISSSRIRDDLQNGNVDEVTMLLGRPYCIHGEVIKGRQIGRSIGFPTANINYKSYTLPQNGVYAVKVVINGEEHIGMCNIGYNPTFDSLDRESLEVNIFDFDQDIYDEIVYVYFYHRIRPEQKFNHQDELIKQLNQDRKSIKEYFKVH